MSQITLFFSRDRFARAFWSYFSIYKLKHSFCHANKGRYAVRKGDGGVTLNKQLHNDNVYTQLNTMYSEITI